MGRLLTAAAVGVLIAAFAVPAQAQRESREYRQTVRRALREFSAGRWEEARSLFTRAHEIHPNARTLRGIGMAAFEMRDYVDAYHALESALSEPERPLTGRQRRQVLGLLEECEPFLGRYRIETLPADAEVTVDLEPIQYERDGTVLLSVGEHTLSVEAEGHSSETRRFVVSGEETRRIEISLRRIGAEPEGPTVDAGQAAADDGGGGSILPIVFLASAGAFVGATAYGIGWTVERGDEVGRCEARPDECVNLPTLTGQRDAAIGFTIASAILAAGLGATALWLFLAGDDEERDDADQAMSCAPALGGVVCAGRFQ